jgi:hypothetical protein
VSHDPQEFQVPIIFDVSGYNREEVGNALVSILACKNLVGSGISLVAGTPRIESWWTVEGTDKQHDRNDNEHGVVVFQDDLDYLLAILLATQDWQYSDPPRHARLITYFSPNGRVGTPERELDEDGY